MRILKYFIPVWIIMVIIIIAISVHFRHKIHDQMRQNIKAAYKLGCTIRGNDPAFCDFKSVQYEKTQP